MATRAMLSVLVVGFAVVATAESGGLLAALPEIRDFRAERVSSFDRTGGNLDGGQDKPIQPGETRVLAELEGAGAITHIWATIASGDPHHLRNLVLRMYWDGEEHPSVETPIGDFFGLGHALYYQYACRPIQIGTAKGLNCFWRMPFADGALVTLTNEGPVPVGAFYYYIDFQRYAALEPGAARFHAQYRQAFPCPPGENYVLLEAEGRGHYVGCNLSIHNRADGWWGEGDDMIYVDGEETPSLHGTGSEDYFGGAWCYGEAFSNLYLGCPLRGPHTRGGLWNVYRYHIEDPIPFAKSIRVTIEHGHANDRADDFASVAYWYQTEPHAPYPALPAAEARVPAVEPYKEAHAIEGESLVDAFSGGPVVVQDMSSFGNQWSGGAHLWFTPDGPASYALDVQEQGVYNVRMFYTAAPDYGLCEAWVNGEKVAEWDGYALTVVRKEITFPVTLREGPNRAEIRIAGKNSASTGYYAGIDCFVPVPGNG